MHRNDLTPEEAGIGRLMQTLGQGAPAPDAEFLKRLRETTTSVFLEAHRNKSSKLDAGATHPEMQHLQVAGSSKSIESRLAADSAPAPLENPVSSERATSHGGRRSTSEGAMMDSTESNVVGMHPVAWARSGQRRLRQLRVLMALVTLLLLSVGFLPDSVVPSRGAKLQVAFDNLARASSAEIEVRNGDSSSVVLVAQNDKLWQWRTQYPSGNAEVFDGNNSFFLNHASNTIHLMDSREAADAARPDAKLLENLNVVNQTVRVNLLRQRPRAKIEQNGRTQWLYAFSQPDTDSDGTVRVEARVDASTNELLAMNSVFLDDTGRISFQAEANIRSLNSSVATDNFRVSPAGVYADVATVEEVQGNVSVDDSTQLALGTTGVANWALNNWAEFSENTGLGGFGGNGSGPETRAIGGGGLKHGEAESFSLTNPRFGQFSGFDFSNRYAKAAESQMSQVAPSELKADAAETHATTSPVDIPVESISVDSMPEKIQLKQALGIRSELPLPRTNSEVQLAEDQSENSELFDASPNPYQAKSFQHFTKRRISDDMVALSDRKDAGGTAADRMEAADKNISPDVEMAVKKADSDLSDPGQVGKMTAKDAKLNAASVGQRNEIDRKKRGTFSGQTPPGNSVEVTADASKKSQELAGSPAPDKQSYSAKSSVNNVDRPARNFPAPPAAPSGAMSKAAGIPVPMNRSNQAIAYSDNVGLGSQTSGAGPSPTPSTMNGLAIGFGGARQATHGIVAAKGPAGSGQNALNSEANMNRRPYGTSNGENSAPANRPVLPGYSSDFTYGSRQNRDNLLRQADNNQNSPYSQAGGGLPANSDDSNRGMNQIGNYGNGRRQAEAQTELRAGEVISSLNDERGLIRAKLANDAELLLGPNSEVTILKPTAVLLRVGELELNVPAGDQIDLYGPIGETKVVDLKSPTNSNYDVSSIQNRASSYASRNTKSRLRLPPLIVTGRKVFRVENNQIQSVDQSPPWLENYYKSQSNARSNEPVRNQFYGNKPAAAQALDAKASNVAEPVEPANPE